MSEMIERVAKAILEEQRKNRSVFPSNIDLARAAIEAMREPTCDMLNAGWRKDGWPLSYRAAIDAALGKTDT